MTIFLGRHHLPETGSKPPTIMLTVFGLDNFDMRDSKKRLKTNQARDIKFLFLNTKQPQESPFKTLDHKRTLFFILSTFDSVFDCLQEKFIKRSQRLVLFEHSWR